MPWITALKTVTVKIIPMPDIIDWNNLNDHKLMTKEQFRKALPYATVKNRAKFYIPLCDIMAHYHIDTKPRMICFLAQVAHESGSLRYVQELASGEAYEGRRDLGNCEPGDGVKFKGRGLIQITGRYNYQAIANEFDLPMLMEEPEILEVPTWAALTAGWFWDKRQLNTLADHVEDLDDPKDEKTFRIITKLINGGYNGYEDRVNNWKLAKNALDA